MIIPNDGTVVIDNVSETSITLRGFLPAGLTSGKVIASALGNGFLRRIVSVTPGGGRQAPTTVVLQTQSAALEELFIYLDFHFVGTLNSDDIAETTPLSPGVSVAPAIRSVYDSTIPVSFKHRYPAEGDEYAAFEAKSNLTFHVEWDGQIIGGETKHFRCQLVLDSVTQCSLLAKYKHSVIEKIDLPLIKIKSKRIPLPGYLNLLFLYMDADLGASLSVDLSGGAGVSGEIIAGLRITAERTESGEWGYDVSPTFSSRMTGAKIFLDAELKLALFEGTVRFSLFNSVGPEFTLAKPIVEAKYARTDTQDNSSVGSGKIKKTTLTIASGAEAKMAIKGKFLKAYPIEYTVGDLKAEPYELLKKEWLDSGQVGLTVE